MALPRVIRLKGKFTNRKNSVFVNQILSSLHTSLTTQFIRLPGCICFNSLLLIVFQSAGSVFMKMGCYAQH